jgi:hypothetical protein
MGLPSATHCSGRSASANSITFVLALQGRVPALVAMSDRRFPWPPLTALASGLIRISRRARHSSGSCQALRTLLRYLLLSFRPYVQWSSQGRARSVERRRVREPVPGPGSDPRRCIIRPPSLLKDGFAPPR